jgi:hypothetical protein
VTSSVSSRVGFEGMTEAESKVQVHRLSDAVLDPDSRESRRDVRIATPADGTSMTNQ